MYFPNNQFNKLTFSIQSVASLIYLLKKQRDAFGISLFTDQLILNTPAKSTGAHQKYLFAQLDQVLQSPRLNVQTNLANALHQVAELIHKRSLVIVFSDMLQSENNEDKISALFSSLQHLKFNKHEVVIFNVIDKSKEVDFNFENTPHEFIDLETGVVLKAHTSKVAVNYVQQMKAYRQQLALRCAQYKIDFIDADIKDGYDKILQSYLIKRQKMR